MRAAVLTAREAARYHETMTTPLLPPLTRRTLFGAPQWVQELLDASQRWAGSAVYVSGLAQPWASDRPCQAHPVLGPASAIAHTMRAIAHDLDAVRALAPSGLLVDPEARQVWVDWRRLRDTWPHDGRPPAWANHRWGELWVQAVGEWLTPEERTAWLEASRASMLLPVGARGVEESRWSEVQTAAPGWHSVLPPVIRDAALELPQPQGLAPELSLTRAEAEAKDFHVVLRASEGEVQSWGRSDPWLQASPWLFRHTERPIETWSASERWAIVSAHSGDEKGALAAWALEHGVAASPHEWADALSVVNDASLVAPMVAQGADPNGSAGERVYEIWHDSQTQLQHALLLHLPRAAALLEAGADPKRLPPLVFDGKSAWEILGKQWVDGYSDDKDGRALKSVSAALRKSGQKASLLAMNSVFEAMSHGWKYLPDQGAKEQVVHMGIQLLSEMAQCADFSVLDSPEFLIQAVLHHRPENTPIIKHLHGQGLRTHGVVFNSGAGLSQLLADRLGRWATMGRRNGEETSLAKDAEQFLAPWDEAGVDWTHEADGRLAHEHPSLNGWEPLRCAVRARFDQDCAAARARVLGGRMGIRSQEKTPRRRF